MKQDKVGTRPKCDLSSLEITRKAIEELEKLIRKAIEEFVESLEGCFLCVKYIVEHANYRPVVG